MGRRHRHRHRPPTADLAARRPHSADHVVALDDADAGRAIRALAPDGVDRIVEVDFSDNVDLDAAIVKVGAVIAAYATRDDRPASRSGRCCSTT